MTTLRKKLALATCTLIAQGAQAADSDWTVDSSYLYYAEADDRVTVKKTLANLTRTLDDGAVTVNLIHDTMSGASPTGALRSGSEYAAFSSASGGSGFSTQLSGDQSQTHFEDTRVQAGIDRERQVNRTLTFNYGGVISSEQDYDSLGTTLGVKKEAANKLSSLNAGIAFTSDSIYRSVAGDTPAPLSKVDDELSHGKGKRYTYDALLGYTQVVNRKTIAQINLTAGLSNGYHSDPYKVISAADNDDNTVANYHDSRPDSRFRTTAYGKVVHELRKPGNSIHLSYRLYQDDWGIFSNTADFRYHHRLTDKQYLEPHFRLYRQSAADFYYRKLRLGGPSNKTAMLPADGYATADYRMDAITSYTAGIKYGVALTRKADLRLRVEYIDKTFDSSEYDSNDAMVVQTSFKYRF
jgi:hypothetical protein